MIHAFALTGPTASGKTSLSIEIAKELGCEIISLDSMQIYKGMDIGTAKASKEELSEVPHHMIDLISPDCSFSAAAYKETALEIAADISARGKIPFFVGGTGLYLSTLLRPECEQPPASDPEYRRKIEENLTGEEERIRLFERLRQIDPISAEALHYNNVRRVIRALEIYDATGKTKSYFDALTKAKNSEITVNHVTLDFHERANLYDRVDARVDAMIEDGLVDEVKSLISKGYLLDDTTAAQAIGYKEILGVVLRGDDFKESIDSLKQATRNYAKRQLTWFRHMENKSTVYIDQEDGTLRSKDDIYSECKSIFIKEADKIKL